MGAGMLINLTAMPRDGAARHARFHYRFDQDEVLVGRTEAVDVRLPHPSVSLVHLRLLRRGQRLLAEDAGSTNRTMLDGTPLQPHEPAPLSPGSRLQVGIFVLVIGEPRTGTLTAPRDTASFARRMVMDVLGELAEDPALQVESGPDRGKLLRLPAGPPLVVGRGDDCDLRLRDADTSRQHLQLRRRQGELLAEDLRSKNGVLVNGEPLQEQRALVDGDELTLGNTVLRYIDPTVSYLAVLGKQQGFEPIKSLELPRVEDAGPHPAPPGELSTDVQRRLRRGDLLLVLVGLLLLGGTGVVIAYLLGWI